jgi:hypothetical protein
LQADDRCHAQKKRRFFLLHNPRNQSTFAFRSVKKTITEAAMVVRNSTLLQEEEINSTADDDTNKDLSKTGNSMHDDSDSSEHNGNSDDDDDDEGENTDAPTGSSMVGSDTNEHNMTAEIRQKIQRENRGVSMWRMIFKIILIVVAILLVIATYVQLSRTERRDFTNQVSYPCSVVIEWTQHTLLSCTGLLSNLLSISSLKKLLQ